jgi:hypothetical protein
MTSLPGLGVGASPNPGFRCAPAWAIVLRPFWALFKANLAGYALRSMLGLGLSSSPTQPRRSRRAVRRAEEGGGTLDVRHIPITVEMFALKRS